VGVLRQCVFHMIDYLPKQAFNVSNSSGYNGMAMPATDLVAGPLDLEKST